MRLQPFILSNDQFYGVIRELTEQMQQANSANIEALIDNEKSVLDEHDNRKIVLKELNLETCETYNHIVSQLDVKEQKTVHKAIQSHLEYMTAKALERVPKSSLSSQEKQSRSFLEKLNYQFMIELLNYQDWPSGKGYNQRKRAKSGWKKRRSRRF